MKAMLVEADAPYCILRLTDARAYVPASHTDIRKTFEAHRHIHAPTEYGDYYDRVMRDYYLSAPGGFA